MDVLKVKINGEWVGIPAIQGEQGPKGDKGDPGQNGQNGVTPNVTAGTTTTGAAGTSASVTRRAGSPDSAPIFDFTIPKGDKGDHGDLQLDSTLTSASAAAPADMVGDLKSAFTQVDGLIYDRQNLIDTDEWVSSTNTAVTNNNDGTYTVGTSDYGNTVFGGDEYIPAGTYYLFGVDAGFSFISTSTSHANAVVTNDTGKTKEVTLSTGGRYYVGFREASKPSASFIAVPSLMKISTAFDKIDADIDELTDREDTAEANINKMLDDGNLLVVNNSSLQHTLGDSTVTVTENNGFKSERVTVTNNLIGVVFNTQAKKQYRIKFTLLEGTASTIYLCTTDGYNTTTYINSWSNVSGTEISYQFYAVTGKTSVWFNQAYDVDQLTVDNFSCSDEILRYKHDITDYCGNEITTFNKILCIGDSLTEGTFNYTLNGSSNNVIADAKYSYPTYLKAMTGRDVYNHGHGGYTAKQWYDTYGSSDLSGYDACIIMLGINDGVQEVGVSQFSTNMTNIINKVKSDNTGIKIFLATLIPAYSDYDSKFDDYIAEIKRLVAEDFADAYLVDINKYSVCKLLTPYAQGHLTAIGYQQLAKEFYTLISYIIHNNLADFKDVQFIGTEYEYES